MYNYFKYSDNENFNDFKTLIANKIERFSWIKSLPILKSYDRDIQIVTGVFLNYLQHYNHNGFIKAEKMLLSLEFNLGIRFWIDNRNHITVFYQGKQVSIYDYVKLIYSLIQTLDTVKAIE